MNQQLSDLFDRQPFAKHLIEQLDCFKTPFSVGLDAQWGDGKTHFINNYLKQECVKKNIPIVVYDCFEHEREIDPFVSLTKEILQLAEAYKKSDPDTGGVGEQIQSVSDKAAKFFIGLGKTAATAGAKIFLKQGLEEISDNFDSSPDSAGGEEDLVKFIEEQLRSGEHIKNLKTKFQESVTELIKQISPDEKFILVVIDELDRCRPNHAVDVLEAVKHLLSIEGIYFIFTYHKVQLQSALRHIYGKELDANLYLQKFIDLDIALPKKKLNEVKSRFSFLFEQFLDLSKLNDFQKKNVMNSASVYYLLNNIYDFTPREIHRCILMHISFEQKSNENDFHGLTRALLTILKVKFGDIGNEIHKGQFPLSDEALRKYKIRELIQLLSEKNSNIVHSLNGDIGFLYEEETPLSSNKTTTEQKKYVIKQIDAVLGSGI